MTKFIKGHRFLAGFLSIIISVFLVSVVVYAATTIGTNVNTAGTVTMESASTTNDFWLGNVIADDDDYLYMDASSSQYMMWDDDPGQFAFSNDLKVTGITTSTLAFWAGTGGTVDNLNMTGGDLYVQDDVEIDGSLWFDSATTTDSLYIGSYASSTSALNTQGTLHVGANATVDGYITLGNYASSTSALNTQGTLHVGGNATVDGEITSVGSTTASIINMTTVKFTPSATPTTDVTGECFVDSNDYQLNCYDGTTWQHAW